MKSTLIKTTFAYVMLSGFLMAGVAQAHEASPSLFTLNGVVLAAASRQPLAGVKVDVFQPSLASHVSAAERGAPTQTLTTGADGRFALNSLTPGPATIIFTKAGYLSIRYDIDLIGRPGPIESSTILMWRPEVSSMPCGGLVQPGVTASVYVVCTSAR